MNPTVNDMGGALASLWWEGLVGFHILHWDIGFLTKSRRRPLRNHDKTKITGHFLSDSQIGIVDIQ